MSQSPSTLPPGYIHPADLIPTMTFALYDNNPLADKANRAGRKVIKNTLAAIDRWAAQYRGAGADDTASREALAINLAKALGLKEYL